jgi:hypothetical protein
MPVDDDKISEDICYTCENECKQAPIEVEIYGCFHCPKGRKYETRDGFHKEGSSTRVKWPIFDALVSDYRKFQPDGKSGELKYL